MAARPPAESPLPDDLTKFDGLAGKLLIATPEMADPRFSGTVIFMVQHDHTGAMGLVINRALGKQPLGTLLDGAGFDGDQVPGYLRVHYGGPVMPQLGFVLHSSDYFGRETTVVNGCAALSRDYDILRAISDGTGPRHALVAFGYAGWGAGQLELELEEKAWTVAFANEAIIFDDDVQTKWQRARNAGSKERCGEREAQASSTAFPKAKPVSIIKNPKPGKILFPRREGWTKEKTQAVRSGGI